MWSQCLYPYYAHKQIKYTEKQATKREDRKQKWKKTGHVEGYLQALCYVKKEQGARDEKPEGKQ